MDSFLQTILAGAAGPMLPSAFLFAAVVAVTFGIGLAVQSRGDIRKRATHVGVIDIDLRARDARSPLADSQAASRKLTDYVTRNFVPDDQKQVARLRRQLVQAGYLQPSAVGWYFGARLGLALLLAGLAFAAVGIVPFTVSIEARWIATAGAGLFGYVLPPLHLRKRIGRNRDEHRAGFPDFMDLMVVCADSGLSMESAIDRVGRELAISYPSLSGNLGMAVLEMRAGRTLGEALDHLGERLAIEEARAFATLLQQSEELGSSLTEALRVYSDDMRHQRLSRAEEKAYALPAKLVIPLGLFVFPILLVVTMMPVYIRLKGYGP